MKFLYHFWYMLGLLCGCFLVCISTLAIIKAGAGLWIVLIVIGSLNIITSGNHIFGGKSE